ncbi:hypothetical protein [Micromonospora rhizosphaerae]|nr:hypothetical protein [Micromonospora rhizosphaerae]
MRAAEQALEQHLPIEGRARTVTLMVQAEDSGTWTRHTTLSLAEPGKS